MKSPYITHSLVESPVSLVVAEAAGCLNAMTVSFFSELAHHPTSLWVSIARTAFTHSLIQTSQRFGLAVLASDQKKIALACGTVSGRDHDKTVALHLYEHSKGFWFLHGALACTACRVRGTLELEDHTIFLADILSGVVDSRRIHLRHLLVSDL